MVSFYMGIYDIHNHCNAMSVCSLQIYQITSKTFNEIGK